MGVDDETATFTVLELSFQQVVLVVVIGQDLLRGNRDGRLVGLSGHQLLVLVLDRVFGVWPRIWAGDFNLLVG